MFVSSASSTPVEGIDGSRRRSTVEPNDQVFTADRISISDDAKSKERAAPEASDESAAKSPKPSVKGRELTLEQEDLLRRLQARYREVRAHEAAHAAVAGQFGGGVSFDFAVGPDGRQYAVGGEVPVRLVSGHTPAETIRNAQRVRAAALAPMSPSAQDRSVAAAAAQMESDARLAQIRETSESQAEKAREAARSRVEQARASGDPNEIKKAENVLNNEDAALRSVVRERQQTGQLQSHAHSMQSCGFCSRAVGSYQTN